MKKRILLSLIPGYLSVLLLLFLAVILGNQAVTIISENAPLKERACVVIDAGHGGVDGGATSCTGVLESQMNLEIALRLNDLMHFLGIKTVMIRTSDRSVYTEGESIAAKKVSDLKERVRIINETENALLVSIHQNYFSDNRYSGAQVFYGDTHDSATFAGQLQSSFTSTINKGSNRRAKKASGVYLLKHIECTGVLVECGFISNPEEEAKLRDKTYQQNICCVIAGTCSNYLYNRIA